MYGVIIMDLTRTDYKRLQIIIVRLIRSTDNGLTKEEIIINVQADYPNIKREQIAKAINQLRYIGLLSYDGEQLEYIEKWGNYHGIRRKNY